MSKRTLAIVMVGALAVLHQDFWLWNDSTLLFGFLPIGLAWHAGYSIVAVAMWAWVVQVAWPADPFEDEA